MDKRNFLRTALLACASAFLFIKNLYGGESEAQIFGGLFGSCCKDLADSMKQVGKSFFVVEDNKVLYLTVGYILTDKGTGWFDRAVIYCPFCGKQLQSREEIAKRSRS
jgi:hypothetical protein